VKTARLSEVCKLVNGGTPKSGVAEYWGGDVAWLTPAEMGKRTTPYIAETARTISKIGLANCSARQVPVGSVIMSTRAPIGHLAIPEIPMAFNQGCRGLIPIDSLDTKYLYYFLWFSREALNELGTGATFKELSSGALGNYPIPLPPLEEQRRFVAVLDEAFAAIATATANAEKNLANAQELFASELDALIREAQESFTARPLIDQCLGVTVGHVGPMKDRYQPTGVPFLRSQNVRPFEISVEGMMFIDDDFDGELKKSRLQPGDVAVVRTGYPGTAAVIPPSLPRANCSDLVIIRPAKSLNPHFVAAFLNSNIGKRAVSGELVGAAQKHFNVGSAKQVPIPVPSLEQQTALVERVAVFGEEKERLVKICRARLHQLAALKNSILHRAFAGKLTSSTLDSIAA
jgi:type I restriction enzyme S subunit